MYFDSHLHSEGLGFSELKTLSQNQIKEVCSLAFFPVKPKYPQTMVDVFRKLMEFEPMRCEAAGIRMYPAVGIHPRCIPPDYEFVLKYLEEGEWVAFGEIGLELVTDEEVEVLKSQLGLAKKLDVPCIIHTPRGEKVKATRKTIEILNSLDFPPQLAVIDHVNFETIDMVLETEYWIGLTIQPGKLSPDDAARIVAEYGSERFMLNSDAGYRDVEIATVASAAEKIAENVGKDEAERVARKNARKFLRL
ncbi:MAG: TatD family hydrolase [Archaeoglobus sp.]|uniref:TatD family hydrolase n=1 Tax=Archaeoglobus sp. TaxID=1872626 RepID=UPI001D295A4A|nr:TatD family hydrolase [Archaeoglobus sp.]MBO8179999.1 TatD family hydrolase [Archaeoglobus sp.]